MLNHFRETSEARNATPGRRIYNYVSVALQLAVGVWVFTTLAPAWIFVVAVAILWVLDIFLTRKWVREDALKAYRADHTG
jgi:hypothetical protein